MGEIKALEGRARSWFLTRIAKTALVILVPLGLVSFFEFHLPNADITTMATERVNVENLSRRMTMLRSLLKYREAFLIQRKSLRVTGSQMTRDFYFPHDREEVARTSLTSQSDRERIRKLWYAMKKQPTAVGIDRLIDLVIAEDLSAFYHSGLSNERNPLLRTLATVSSTNAPQLMIVVYRLNDSLELILKQRPLDFSERVQAASLLTTMETLKLGLIDSLLIIRHDVSPSKNKNDISREFEGRITGFFRDVEPVVLGTSHLTRSEQYQVIVGDKTKALAAIDTLISYANSQMLEVLDHSEQHAHFDLFLIEGGIAFLWVLGFYVVVQRAIGIHHEAEKISKDEEREAQRQNEEILRRNAEIALATKMQTFRAVFERAPVGIAMIDTNGDITEWNPELQRFLENRRLNLIGDQWNAFHELLAQKIPILTFERIFKNPQGEELWVSFIVSRVYDDGSHVALCMMQDITEKRNADARLRHEAMHDGLTGLANRRLFRSSIATVLTNSRQSQEPFAILFIDLDLFKYVNDTFGHAAGDFVLGTIAERLRKIAGLHDLVARFGGDEFAILVVPPCEDNHGEKLAHAINTSVAEPIFWEGHQVNVGSSIGLIYGPGPYLHAEELMRDADTAMYAAKSAGRGRYVLFDPLMQEAAHLRAQLSNDLQSALSDPEQIHVMYQPIVSLVDNAIMGFEALVRWNHPQIGEIAPDDFVKIAEQSGAIRQLGRSVMRKAFSQLTIVGERLPDLSRLWLSVNLSPSELSAPDFVESVAAAIRETNFDPSRLYLEITESRVIDSGEQANRILSRLREFGIRISIDDFGAGYSSLRYLQELDLDLIKIDRGFFQRADEVDSRTAVLRAIVGLARAFELPVCAEGVETYTQLELVKSLGFQYAQGRIWGNPMSIAEIEARFACGGTFAESDRSS